MAHTVNRTPQYLILITIAILLALGLVHLVYGEGCWGLQPGGTLSGMLFDLQAVISLGAVLYCCVITFRYRDRPGLLALSGIAMVFLALAVWQYMTVGWRMGTSIHYQGSENLPTFLLTSAVSIVIGVQALMARKAMKRMY